MSVAKTKEEFYEFVKESRIAVNDENNLKCKCPKVNCEWHGNCKKCVALHRYHANHIPNCLQFIINDKLKALVGVGEMTASEKEYTPAEYWEYARGKDKEDK